MPDENYQCEVCGEPATVHLTEIRFRQKIEKHLCVQCASDQAELPGQKSMAALLAEFVARASKKP